VWQPVLVPPLLLEASRRLRKTMTDPEVLLWECLRRRQLGGFRFRRQHPLGGYVLDFLCTEVQLAIELDGARHFTMEGRESDRVRSDVLAQHGIRVLRFENRQVLDDIGTVVEQIWQALQAPRAGEP
jgi:very-short-patch-repair endonuclease